MQAAIVIVAFYESFVSKLFPRAAIRSRDARPEQSPRKTLKQFRPKTRQLSSRDEQGISAVMQVESGVPAGGDGPAEKVQRGAATGRRADKAAGAGPYQCKLRRRRDRRARIYSRDSAGISRARGAPVRWADYLGDRQVDGAIDPTPQHRDHFYRLAGRLAPRWEIAAR